jgi:hypothetical protein
MRYLNEVISFYIDGILIQDIDPPEIESKKREKDNVGEYRGYHLPTHLLALSLLLTYLSP